MRGTPVRGPLAAVLTAVAVAAAGPSPAAPVRAAGPSADGAPPAAPPTADGARWVAGPKGEPMTLADALQQARDGDTIELLPGTYDAEPLRIEGRRLRLRGVPDAAGRLPVIDGARRLTAARALWTVAGGEIVIENLEFRGARGNDGEGAGLRQEGGRLTVRRARFHDNERGLRAHDDPEARLQIDDSEFGMAPRRSGGLPHLLDVGRIAQLAVRGSRFQQGFEGQLLKTRARDNVIANNFIHDGARGGASYEIEIAAGGQARVVGNVIGQGAESQNRVVLAYGTDAWRWDGRQQLVVAHNTFVNHGWVPAWFVRVFGRRPAAGGDPRAGGGAASAPGVPAARNGEDGEVDVVAVNNLLVGPGLLWPLVRGRVEGNRPVTRSALRDAETYAFELSRGSWWRGSAVDPRAVQGLDLTPTAEFEWPVGTVPIAPPADGRWSPGAYQR